MHTPVAEATIRNELAVERAQLADALHDFRRETDVRAQLRARLPLVLAGAFALGFVLSGGIGATMRLAFRRGREGRTAARVGRYVIVERG
jgi:hypothetical protein